MAERILRSSNDYEPLGKNWIESFFKRNPRVKTLIGRKIEAQRKTKSQYDAIEKFSSLVKQR